VRLVYPMLSLSLDCQFLIALRFSLTFISNLIIFLIVDILILQQRSVDTVDILVLQQRSVDTVEHKRIYLPRKIWTCHYIELLSPSVVGFSSFTDTQDTGR
jgi:hypothetical protein